MSKWLLMGVLVLGTGTSGATVIIAQESFEGFEAHGLSPGGAHGTLDSDTWRVLGASSGDSQWGDSIDGGDFGRGLSSGGVRSGGLYAFELPTQQRALGVQATASDFSPGELIWALHNPTLLWLEHITVFFELWWINNGARSTRIATAASLDGIRWVALDALNTEQYADDSGWRLRPQTGSLGRLRLAPAAPLWMRWRFDDGAGSGSRDEFALSSVQVRALPATAPVLLAAPSAGAVLLLGVMLIGRRQRLRAHRQCVAARTAPAAGDGR